MVEVGVGQHHRIERRHIEIKRAVVQRFQRARPLKHAAIDQNALTAQRELHAGPGDGLRRAMKADLQRMGLRGLVGQYPLHRL